MGNSSSQIQLESDIFFTSEETDKEANTVTWLQNQFLDLNQNNIFVITESIIQSYELKSELNINQFIYNIILMYRIRPKKSELYSDLIFQICEKLESGSENFKRNFLHYIRKTSNTGEPHISAVPYLSLLFRLFKKKIFTFSDILTEIEYMNDNYIEFSSYLCTLYCWFYFEIKKENQELFKILHKIYKEKSDHWLFPSCLKRSIKFMSKQANIISKSQKDDSNNSCSVLFDELDEMRETGFVPNSIFDMIRKDDINSFEKLASLPTFNPDSVMEETIFNPYPILHYNPHLIQIAAFFGSIKIFKFLLLNDAKIDCIDSNEMELIHFAIAGGNTEIIRILEQNDVSFGGTTQIASQYHQHDILEWLIDNKFSDLSMLDPKFGSISHNAAISNDLYILKLIETSIEENENDNEKFIEADKLIYPSINLTTKNDNILDKPNPKGLAPLQYAISNGCFDIVYYLISTQKADIYRVDSDLDTSLHIASSCGYSSIARFLHTMGPSLLLTKNKKGINPIQVAVSQGHDHILSYFLKQKDIDFNMVTSEGKTLLHLAAERGHSACIKVILKHQGVFISAHDNEGKTPLHQAACKNQIECVRVLLEQKGIDINNCDDKYRTPLHDALRYSSTELIELLLKQPQIDCNVFDQEGKTPLILAVELKNRPIAKILLANPDVDVNMKSFVSFFLFVHTEISFYFFFNGIAALHVAIYHSDLKIVKELQKRKDINYAVRTNVLLFFFLLLTEWNSFFFFNRTPLHFAAERGDLNLVKFILQQKGVNLNETTNTISKNFLFFNGVLKVFLLIYLLFIMLLVIRKLKLLIFYLIKKE